MRRKGTTPQWWELWKDLGHLGNSLVFTRYKKQASCKGPGAHNSPAHSGALGRLVSQVPVLLHSKPFYFPAQLPSQGACTACVPLLLLDASLPCSSCFLLLLGSASHLLGASSCCWAVPVTSWMFHSQVLAASS